MYNITRTWSAARHQISVRSPSLFDAMVDAADPQANADHGRVPHKLYDTLLRARSLALRMGEDARRSSLKIFRRCSTAFASFDARQRATLCCQASQGLAWVGERQGALRNTGTAEHLSVRNLGASWIRRG